MPQSLFNTIRPRWACLVLVLCAALLAALVAVVARTDLPWNGSNRDVPGDIDLYRAVVARVHAGQNYYRVLSEELPKRGYPTAQVFNWRMPLPLWAIAQLPDPSWARHLLALLALAGVVASFRAVAAQEPAQVYRAWLTALLLTGPLLLAILGDAYLMPVVWAGVFIGLSLAAYGLNRPGWAVGLGLAALAVRELALPYCATMAALALWQRRRETISWAAGIGLWIVYVLFHAWNVQAAMPAHAEAHQQGWIQFGGLAFVLGTVRMNAWLIVLPPWATACYWVPAMLGLAGWMLSPFGRRIACVAGVYTVAYAMVGQSFNLYWGCVVSCVWCLGAAQGLPTIILLLRRSVDGLRRNVADRRLLASPASKP